MFNDDTHIGEIEACDPITNELYMSKTRFKNKCCERLMKEMKLGFATDHHITAMAKKGQANSFTTKEQCTVLLVCFMRSRMLMMDGMWMLRGKSKLQNTLNSFFFLYF